MTSTQDTQAAADPMAEFREELAAVQAEGEFLREAYSRLEYELEAAGWRQIGQGDSQEPTREALRQAVELSRYGWLKNPILRRAADLQASYVFGLPVNFKASDETIQAAMQAFIEDPQNQAELFDPCVREQRERELSLDGELFVALFPNIVTGVVRIATIAPGQISRVETDPENSKRPWLYLREWTADGFSLQTGPTGARQERAYYPAVGFNPPDKPESINGIRVRWDVPVLHFKVGGFSDWKRGFPEREVSRPYATSYKDFIADWATIAKALARFAWRYTGSASTAETAAVKARIGTTVGQSGALGVETNPPVAAGSVALLPPGRALEPIRTAGASVSAEDGRQLRVMAIAATGFGDHFFGDAQQGALATAKSLDRPTELRIKGRQQFWSGVYRQIFGFVLLWGVRAPRGALRRLGRVVPPPTTDPAAPPSVKWRRGIDPTISIDWPQVVEADALQQIQALVQAAPFLPTELVSQLMMVALEVDGIDKWLDTLRKERKSTSAPAAAGAADPEQKQASGA